MKVLKRQHGVDQGEQYNVAVGNRQWFSTPMCEVRIREYLSK